MVREVKNRMPTPSYVEDKGFCMGCMGLKRLNWKRGVSGLGRDWVLDEEHGGLYTRGPLGCSNQNFVRNY